MLIALLFAAIASNTDSVPLTPSGKWVIEYADTMCVLSRDYGVGGDQITVGLRPWPMGTETEIVLLTQKGAVLENGKASLTLLPGGHSSIGSYSRYPMPKGPGRIATLSLDQDALSGLDASNAIELRLGDKESHSIAIPAIGAAITALETCQNNLLKTWGLDPGERAVVVTPPKANVAAFFGSDQYPSEAIRAGEQGRTIAIASIDSGGKVSACAVAVTSGSAVLDQTTCQILKNRAHFSAGLGKDGKPVASHAIVPVHWSLPN